jgi:hypothetical protein
LEVRGQVGRKLKDENGKPGKKDGIALFLIFG